MLSNGFMGLTPNFGTNECCDSNLGAKPILEMHGQQNVFLGMKKNGVSFKIKL
jgi:hypothetical protein